MIIAGSVDVAGIRSDFSQGGTLLDISAPGELDSQTGLQCAGGTGIDTIVRKSGTSLSAPTVAGVCAYFMSIDSGLNTPSAVKAFLKSKMFQRNGGPKAVWNGQESSKMSAATRRQEIADTICPYGVLSDDLPPLRDSSTPPPVGWTPSGWQPDSGAGSSVSSLSANSTSAISSTSLATSVAITTSSASQASSAARPASNETASTVSRASSMTTLAISLTSHSTSINTNCIITS